jgi:hypothetical protein
MPRTFGELSTHESRLRGAAEYPRCNLKDADARRHFNFGFIPRFYMLQASRLFLEGWIDPDRTHRSVYDVTECAVHVNAYYLNLRGALDNLAWTLQYEWGLLPGVVENQRRGRFRCSLFNDEFVSAVRCRSAHLGDALADFKDWANELAEFRDPAAHRVPLYAARTVLTSQQQMDEFHRIGADASLSEEARGARTVGEILGEASDAGDFVPVMFLSEPDKLQYFSIEQQIGRDHAAYLLISGEVVEALTNEGRKGG